MKRLVILVLSLALFGTAYFWLQESPAASSADAASDPGATARAPAAMTPTSPATLNLAQDLNAANGDIHTDLQILAMVLDTFRTNFLRSGNPVGSNAEITAALTGDNPLRLAFIARTHPAMNAAGELCDRWGTPFFFHAETGTRMGIRSAGPDRRLFTADDAVLAP